MLFSMGTYRRVLYAEGINLNIGKNKLPGGIGLDKCLFQFVCKLPSILKIVEEKSITSFGLNLPSFDKCIGMKLTN